MNLPDSIIRHISNYLQIQSFIQFSNCSQQHNQAILTSNFIGQLLSNRYNTLITYQYNTRLYDETLLTLHLQMIYRHEQKYYQSISNYYSDLFVKKYAKQIYQYRLKDLDEEEKQNPMILYDTEIFNNLLSKIDSLQCICNMITMDYKNNCRKILLNNI